MEKVEGSLAQPGHTVVRLAGGTVKGIVRPWTMAQRAELKPRVIGLLDRLGTLDGKGLELNLATVFSEAEEELIEIARLSVELPDGVAFDQLLWEDLPIIVQAVWETSVARADGTGLLGKAAGLLGNALGTALTKAASDQKPQHRQSQSTQ